MQCPYDIFKVVTENAAASADKRAKLVAAKDSRDDKQNLRSLTELFPNMPAKSMQELLEHGFKKGSGRVGRAMKLDEEERIELAVHAHIRHRYTDYESYLREQRKVGKGSSNPRSEARERVHEQVKNIADSWRPQRSAVTEISVPRRYPQRVTTLAANVSRETGKNKGYKRRKVKAAGAAMLSIKPHRGKQDTKPLKIQTARIAEADKAARRSRQKARRKARREAARVELAELEGVEV